MDKDDEYLTDVTFDEYIPKSEFVHLSRLSFCRVCCFSSIKIFMLESLTSIKYSHINLFQDNKLVKWDLSLRPNSVACVLYHRGKNALLFVKQFRPGT